MHGELATGPPHTAAARAAGVAGASGPAWRVAVLVALFVLLHSLLEQPALDAPLFALNAATADAAIAWLALAGVNLWRDGTLLLHAHGFATEVHQVCTALLPAALLAVGITMHPRGSAGHKLFGILLGTLVVVLVNQCRLVGVVWVGVQAPALFGLVHGWLAPAALLGLTLGYAWAWARVVRSALSPSRSSVLR